MLVFILILNFIYLQYNRGGPLLCDNELAGIQTYTQNCNQPYLYQKLSAWENLLSCAVEEKCSEEQCGSICSLINKDPLTTTTLSTTPVTDYESDTFTTVSQQSEDTTSVSPTLTTEEITTLIETTEETTTVTTTLATDVDPLTDERPTMTSKIFMANKFDDVSPETTGNIEAETRYFTEESERSANVLAQRHRLRSEATLKKIDSMSIFTSVNLLIFRYFS